MAAAAGFTTFLSLALMQYVLNNWEEYLQGECYFCGNRKFLYGTLRELFKEHLPDPHYSVLEEKDLFYPLDDDLDTAIWVMKQANSICTKSDEELHDEFTLRILRSLEEKSDCQKIIDNALGEEFSPAQSQAFPGFVIGLERIRSHKCPDGERHQYPDILPIKITY